MQRRSDSWSHREAIYGGNAASLTFSGEPSSAVPLAMAAAVLPSSAFSCRRRPGSFSHGGQLLRTNLRRLTLPAAPPSSPGTARDLLRRASEGSPADILGGFHSSVNGKDMKTLGELWSDDCLLEDLSISSRPFQGRKPWGERQAVLEVIHEGKPTTAEEAAAAAAAVWHLGYPSPGGAGIYEFSQEPGGGSLRIRKALVAVEWPLKAGEVLKIITSTFDRFPLLAEEFLKKSSAIGQLVMSIYKNWVKPLILPLLLSYTGMWAHAMKTLQRLARILLGILRKLM
ncbi:unnamed protein product [Spirodela intermedia]|uniref:Uncharacterized protein n=1 Tax=Spirodela intermedia TaxID=51605 RepID=A0A7I8JBW3_SPIIN|nr:unnamed protein product [Spirodela intermedia]CAA6666942.1 unnamed protein product [Spirodela intermedia]